MKKYNQHHDWHGKPYQQTPGAEQNTMFREQAESVSKRKEEEIREV